MSSGLTVRKLAAIMFTDIAGYTAFVQQDEADALRKVAKHRRHLEELTRQYQGQVIQFYGDGSLSIYDSVVDAVKCAIAMQAAYQQDERVPVRIGLHMGDFVMKDGTIFGDGVNISSRIQAEGIPGAILISDRVNSELHNHSDIQTTRLGSYHLKNVTDPVDIYAVVAPGLTIPPRKKADTRSYKRWAFYLAPLLLAFVIFQIVQPFRKSATGIGTIQEERIAVPAFEDFTGKPEYSTVSKMAAHWITTELIESVHASVVSYQSAVENTQVAFASMGPKKFASQTGAVNVIQGTYRLVGRQQDSLEFSVNVVNLETGEYLKEFAVSSIRCPGIDPMICIRELANSIKGYWESKNENPVKLPKYDAYKAYLDARAVWIKDDARAEALLIQSLTLDSAFIDAYFLMLDLYYNEGRYAEADSLITTVKSRFTDLTERQRNYLKYHEADVAGRRQEAFTYFLKEHEIDPKDLFVNTSGMIMAMEYLNEPEMVIHFFKEIDADSLDLSACIYCTQRFTTMIRAQLAKGNIREARKYAQRLRGYALLLPQYMRLVEFYIADGDTTALNSLLFNHTAEQNLGSDYPYIFLVAGKQALLRGNTPMKKHYAKIALDLSDEETITRARAYYLLDDLDNAARAYSDALQKDTTDVRYYAELGMIHARQNDRAQAEASITKLESFKSPYDYGKATYFQARIAAYLGDQDRALDLLRKALGEGYWFWGSVSFSEDPDLLQLRDHPEYQKLLHSRWISAK